MASIVITYGNNDPQTVNTKPRIYFFFSQVFQANVNGYYNAGLSTAVIP